MLRSLFTAVTGVRAHQTMLDVTGNNISNANTVGFKKDFTIFADMMYQSNKYASGAGETRGGVNPAQVGLGVSVSAIETIHTQGSAQYTGNPSDMMIQGNGFLVYKNGNVNLYSRSGATVRDANSDLVQSGTGYYLQGYKIEEGVDGYERASDLSNVNIPLGKKIEPKATSEVMFQCILNSNSKAYLPYGFPDLPFNTRAGWVGETDDSPTGLAKVTINDIDCDLSFTTNTSSATGYLTITFDDNIAVPPPSIVFDMTGVRTDGTPALTPDANSAQLVIGPAASPKTMNVSYDDDTGMLKLIDATTSEVVFQNNLKQKMNYTSFQLEDTSTSPTTYIPVIAEFDESVVTMGSGSDLSQTGAVLKMWYQDTSGAVAQMTAQVYFNADGTFSTVNPVVGGVAPFTDPVFTISPSEDGTYLNIQQDKNPSSPSGSYKSVSQINIGAHHSTKQTIYDALGNEHTLELNFKKLTEDRWRWEAFLVNDDGGIEYNVGVPNPCSGEIEFTGNGTVSNVVDSNGTRHGPSVDDSNVYVEVDVPFSLDGTGNSTIKLNFGGGSGTQPGDVLMGVTQFASETTTKAVYQDGYPMGVLENYSIGQDGTITGAYSNGKNIPMYRVAIATFANEQGLDKVGDTMFRETVNSGYANIDPAQVNGKGTIVAQTLEMSNVDLTEEFTHLIISQRGFQANTRVITTSDQILEEVVNLKR